jgi:molybdate transport system substrate-binding protein
MLIGGEGAYEKMLLVLACWMEKGHNRFVSILTASLVLILILFSACSRPYTPSPVVVFAAGGTRPAIDELCRGFEEQYSLTVETIYGGGGEVLSKMMLAKSGDIYVAPEQRFMETAMEKKVIDPATIRTVAYLVPVIAVKKGNPKGIYTLADLANEGVRVAITRPETTLLGQYAPEIFRTAGLEEAIMQHVVTYASDPNNLLTMLMMGQVDAGIIWHFYGTMASDKIEAIFIDPGQLTGIGKMQIAITTYSSNTQRARQFVDFAKSAAGKATFKRCGYIVDAEEVKQYWH